MLRHLLFNCIFALCALLPASWATAAESVSSTIYSDVEQSVYQIQVINKQTGEKNAIGSGFIIQEDNLIATNYHVVSTFVNNPKTYELGFLSTTKQTGRLELLSVDVIHDLAVLKAPQPLGKPMNLGSVPAKGARLYSLGNPLDKGFSIVEGTNNGIMTASDDNNILFSGSLNPGMSGGPALNEQQQVIGINVATSGNGISFLVPAQHLAALLARLQQKGYTPDANISGQIAGQLRDNADKYIAHLQSAKWGELRIGNFSSVPGNIEGATRCWDNSEKQLPNDLTKVYYTRCDNENSIYLDEKLEVGKLAYEYIWLETDAMIPPRFYRRYEALNSSMPDSDAGEQDVTNFACYTNFTDVSGQAFKMTVCRRDYLHYAGLSDVLITGAMVGYKQQGMLFNLDMTGVNFDSGMKLFKQMLEGFKWQK
ncbi:MAG: hypothetical protein RI964_1890 [Pseudomonadota bacterium]